MKLSPRDERGAVATGAIVTVLSLLLGGGAAAAAVSSVLSSAGPQDSNAVQTGPKDIVDPETVLNYGG